MPAESENLTPLQHEAQNRCFGCGPANPIGLHMEFSVAPDGTIVANKTVTDNYEGPRGYVHGGMIATMLDETMAKTVRAKGLTAVTRQLSVEYLRPVPSGVAIRLVGRVVRSEGRKHFTEAHIESAAGKVLATASGLFIEINPRHLQP